MANQKVENKSSQENQSKRVLFIFISLSLLIFAILYVFFSQEGFSKEQISASVKGPQQIKSGQPYLFEITIANNSSKSIEDVRIEIEPSSILKFEDLDEDRKVFEVESIGSKEEYTESISVVAQSVEEEAHIDVSAQYSPMGLNGRFSTSPERYKFFIGSFDADITIDAPPTAFVQEEISGVISITPNETLKQDNLQIEIQPPSSFEITSSAPSLNDRMSWDVSSFEEGETKEFSFRGYGTKTGDFVIDFKIGIKEETLALKPLSIVNHAISITDNPLIASIDAFNKEDFFVTSDELIDLTLNIANKGEEELNDIVIKMNLPDEILAVDSFYTDPIFKENGNTIEISHELVPQLSSIKSKKEIDIPFQVKSKDFSLLSFEEDEEHIFNVEVVASSENGIVRNEIERQILLKGDTNFEQKVLKDSDLLLGQGPLPPVVGRRTSYIIVWSLSNDINTLNDIKVEAKLPDNVEFSGEVALTNEDITYNEDENTVIWEVESMQQDNREVHLEVWLTPEEEHIGLRIPIVQSTIITYYNASIRESINERISSVSTALPDDESISIFEGIVEDR